MQSQLILTSSGENCKGLSADEVFGKLKQISPPGVTLERGEVYTFRDTDTGKSLMDISFDPVTGFFIERGSTRHDGVLKTQSVEHLRHFVTSRLKSLS